MKNYNYTNSDIFNSFIEISEKKGLVSLAEDDSKKALDKNPRADSLTKEKIGKLYGLKPESPKEMNYKNNIMEVAHPKPVVIQDAYDKLNGLVENNIERQNAILKIVNKKTNGLLMQHKHAQDELTRSLVKAANLLESKNEIALAKLADECLEEMATESAIDSYKKAKKNVVNSLLKTSSYLANFKEIKLASLALQCAEDIENM